MPKTNDAIRLVSIEGEYIRKLHTIAVRLDGKPGLFRITGENEAGKTTCLDIVAMLFGGAKAVKRETMQEGQDGAWCRGTLNNGYSIERRFTAAAPDGYLDVITPDNASVKSPQKVLDGWAGAHSWDPGALLRKKASEIEAIVLGLAKDPDLRAKRQAIGVKRQALQEERLPYNREIQRAQRTEKPGGDKPEPVDVSGEMARLKGLREQEREGNAALNALEEALEALDDRRAAVEEYGEHIAEIERQLAEAKAQLPRLEKAVKQADADASKAKEVLDLIPHVGADISACERRISEADAVNRALAPWQEYDRAQREAGEAKKEAATITARLKKLDAEEEALLKAAEIPVRGIGFSPAGEMQLDGHALEVASGMRKLDMACDIAFAANPAVKVVLLDEANDYGLPALEALNARAKEKGWQVLACRIGLEGPGEIVVEDGEARNRDTVDAAQAALDF